MHSALTVQNVLRAQSESASDVLLVPTFEAKRTALFFENGCLDKTRLPVDREVATRSGFKLRLFKAGEQLSGLEKHKHLKVVCDLVTYKGVEWLIARQIRRKAKGEWLPVKAPKILQLHIMQAKGIVTILPLCSWLAVCGTKPDGSAKHRSLPDTEKTAVKQLAARLTVLNEVLAGSREHYWKAPGLFPKRKTAFGRRVLPVREVTGILVGDVYTPKRK